MDGCPQLLKHGQPGDDMTRTPPTKLMASEGRLQSGDGEWLSGGTPSENSSGLYQR